MLKNLTTKKYSTLFHVVVPSDSVKNRLSSVAVPRYGFLVRAIFPSNLMELCLPAEALAQAGTAMRFLNTLCI